jgi:hypothetical protein
MELLRRQFLHIATTVAVLPTVLSMARGEANVSRPLHLIVGFAAGSSVDIIARLTAEQITKAQGLTIVVENQPGAGTVLATEAGSRAAPDGNTLLIISPPFVINPHLRKLNYNPLTSFEPICDLLHTPTFIVGLTGWVGANTVILLTWNSCTVLRSELHETFRSMALPYEPKNLNHNSANQSLSNSNRVSGFAIWRLKFREQRLAPKVPPPWLDCRKFRPQRLASLRLSRGNVAAIFSVWAQPAETALAGWGGRTRTRKCVREPYI